MSSSARKGKLFLRTPCQWNAPDYIQKPVKQALQSMNDTIPTGGPSDYSKPIHFISGPAIPAAEGRPEFHEATYKPPKLTNPHTQNAFIQLHAQIYKTGCTPLIWHRSQGTAIPKYNGKKGVQGSRLVHVLDPIGKAFFAKKHQQTTLTDNDTGFAANRRREFAILCQNCTNFKLTRAKRNFVNNNHDCTNAFCCTRHEECDEICEKIFLTIQRTPSLENKDTTGLAAKFKQEKTTEIR